MDLFGTPVQTSHVTHDDLDLALESSGMLSLLEENKVWNCSVETSYFSENHKEALAKLNDALDKCVMPFAVNYVKPYIVGGPSEVLFDHIWVNRYEGKSHQERHSHPGSEVSFVYMYKTTERHSRLRFHNTNEAHIYDIKDRTGVLFSELEVDVFLQPREVIFFPSYLQHCVSPCEANGERITLSGNITVRPVEN